MNRFIRKQQKEEKNMIYNRIWKEVVIKELYAKVVKSEIKTGISYEK